MTAIMGSELLQGERVYLDAITKEDLPRLVDWFGDIETDRLARGGIAFPWTLEDAEDRYAMYRNTQKAQDRFEFAIRLKDGGEFIGDCGLTLFNWQARKASVVIVIGDKQNWGKGYGTDAMRVLLRYGFLELNLNRIGLGTFSYNPRAIRAYEKLGFTNEGTLRKAIFHDHSYYDVIIMGLLRREWEAARP